jgi:DNA-binding CsgD family transcriptional regulator
MNSAEPTSDDALLVRLRLWHSGCWVLNVSDRVEVGLLGYGVFKRENDRGTTRYTLYGDTQAEIEAGLTETREHPAVYDVIPMTGGFHRKHEPAPGNVTRELLVEHDASTQIASAFTSRGFVYAAPCDTRANEERWTLYVNADRETVHARIEEIENDRDASISVESITTVAQSIGGDPLPTDRLSHRQREVFQLARRRGYYQYPKTTSATELAEELGVTTSTVHEHLQKAEQKILDLT